MFVENNKRKFILLTIFISMNVGYLMIYFNDLSVDRLLIPSSTSRPRIFIFTTDNRPILHNDSQFYSIGASINFVYARRYGYTYRYYRSNYNNSRKIAQNIPFAPGCFNQVLNQERSAHWAKLQVGFALRSCAIRSSIYRCRLSGTCWKPIPNNMICFFTSILMLSSVIILLKSVDFFRTCHSYHPRNARASISTHAISFLDMIHGKEHRLSPFRTLDCFSFDQHYSYASSYNYGGI